MKKTFNLHEQNEFFMVSPQHKNANIRVFHKYTTLAIMPILASEVLLRENKKVQKQNVTPVSIEPLA